MVEIELTRGQVKCVHWSKSHNKLAVQFCSNNRRIFLGYFDTPEEAYQAYCKAADQNHGEFACYD